MTKRMRISLSRWFESDCISSTHMLRPLNQLKARAPLLGPSNTWNIALHTRCMGALKPSNWRMGEKTNCLAKLIGADHNRCFGTVATELRGYSPIRNPPPIIGSGLDWPNSYFATNFRIKEHFLQTYDCCLYSPENGIQSSRPCKPKVLSTMEECTKENNSSNPIFVFEQPMPSSCLRWSSTRVHHEKSCSSGFLSFIYYCQFFHCGYGDTTIIVWE